MKASIEQIRDEINLKARIGKAEAKEELEKPDEKWNSFLAQYKPPAVEAGKAVFYQIARPNPGNSLPTSRILNQLCFYVTRENLRMI